MFSPAALGVRNICVENPSVNERSEIAILLCIKEVIIHQRLSRHRFWSHYHLLVGKDLVLKSPGKLPIVF